MTLSELFDKADEMVAKRCPDCNASIKEMNSYRDGYIHGMTEKLEGMVPIEKVCEWVENHIFDFPWYDNEQSDFSSKDVANALRKAMEK